MNYFGSFGNNKNLALERLLPRVEEILKVHEQNDYDGFGKLITPELANKVTREVFTLANQEMRPNLGTLVSMSYLAAFNRNEDPMLLFCAKYSGTEDDILVTVTFKNNSEPALIDHIWIE